MIFVFLFFFLASGSTSSSSRTTEDVADSDSSDAVTRRHSIQENEEEDGVPVDTTLTSDDWDLLLAGAKCETVAKDTVIIAEEEWATRIYQIGKGSVS